MFTPRITVFPLGNADTSRLDLRDGRKMLVDYADMRNGDDRADKRIELPAMLRRDLRASSRTGGQRRGRAWFAAVANQGNRPRGPISLTPAAGRRGSGKVGQHSILHAPVAFAGRSTC